jgi:hypothetical protein
MNDNQLAETEDALSRISLGRGRQQRLLPADRRQQHARRCAAIAPAIDAIISDNQQSRPRTTLDDVGDDHTSSSTERTPIEGEALSTDRRLPARP